MKKNLVFFVILSLQAAFVFAQTTKDDKRSVRTLTAEEVFEDEKIVSELAKILSSHAVVLDRPLVVFRYENLSKPTTINPNSMQEVKASIAARTALFLNPLAERSHYVVGHGIYTASDPVVSRKVYGGEQPALYVFKIKSGSIIFDYSSFADWAKTERLAQSSGCKPLGILSLGTWSESTEFRCRNNFIEAFKKLKISGILYGWELASNALAGARNGRFDALNIISAEAIDFYQSAFYSNEKKIEPSAEFSSLIHNLYLESLKDPFFHREKPESLKIPRTLQDSSIAQKNDFDPWLKENIWRCGQRRKNLEDIPYRLYLENTQEYHIDSVTADLIRRAYDASEAARKRGVFVIFDYMQLKIGLERFTQAFEEELDHRYSHEMTVYIVKLFFGADPETRSWPENKKVQEYLRLTGEIWPAFDEFIAKNPEALKNNTAIFLSYADELSKKYLGTNRTLKNQINTSDMFIAFKNIQPNFFAFQNAFYNTSREFSMALPKSLAKDKTYEERKKLYNEIIQKDLRYCISIYENTALTNEQVYASPCGGIY